MTISKELADLLLTGEDLTPSERLSALLSEKGFDSNEKLSNEINARITFRSGAITRTIPETIAKWKKNGIIPSNYYPLLSGILGLDPEPHLQTLFSADSRKEEINRLVLQKEESPRYGYFADLFCFLILTHKDRVEDLLPRLGVYKSSFDGMLKGEVIPSRRVLENIIKGLGANSKAIDPIMELVNDDLERINKKELFTANIIGAIDAKTNIGQIFTELTKDGHFVPTEMAKVKSEFRLSAFYKYRQNTETQHHVNDQAIANIQNIAKSFFPSQDRYQDILSELAERKLPRKRFEAILLDYVKTAGKDTSMQGFIETVCQDWEITREALAKEIGLSGGRILKSWANPSSRAAPEDLKRIYEVIGIREKESKLEFLALVNGSHQGVSIDDLCNQAEAILQADPKKIPNELKDNLIYQRMVSRNFFNDGNIDKSKLSCSLCEVLLERSGFTKGTLQEQAGVKSQSRRFNKVITGEITVTTFYAGTIKHESVAKAREVAQIFTSSPEKSQRLELLFQGIVKKEKPEALLKRVKDREITPEEAIVIHRRQECMPKADFMAKIEENGGTICIETLIKVENQTSKISIEENATAIARAIGLREGSDDEREFTRALMGKIVVSKVTIEALNKAVDKAMEKGSKLDFKHFIRPIMNHLECEFFKELGDLIITEAHPSGISLENVRGWHIGGKEGRNGKVGNREVAEKIADLVGFDEERKDGFVRIAMGMHRTYDPKIVDSLSAESSPEERKSAIAYLREFQGYTQRDMGPIVEVGKTYYKDFENLGGFPSMETQISSRAERIHNKREQFLQDFANEVIPDSFLEQRDHLINILSSPLQEVGIPNR